MHLVRLSLRENTMANIIDYYEVTVDPAESLLDLAAAKQWIRTDTDITVDDTVITALIDAATDMCEKYTNRCFVTRSLKGYFSGLAMTDLGVPFIQVRRSPMVDLTSIFAFYEGAEVEVDSSTYQRQKRSTFDRIYFDETPSVDDDVPYPIRVTFSAGLGAAADISEAVKTAVRQVLLFLYVNRGEVVPDGQVGLPLETKAILSKYRILNTF